MVASMFHFGGCWRGGEVWGGGHSKRMGCVTVGVNWGYISVLGVLVGTVCESCQAIFPVQDPSSFSPCATFEALPLLPTIPRRDVGALAVKKGMAVSLGGCGSSSSESSNSGSSSSSSHR